MRKDLSASQCMCQFVLFNASEVHLPFPQLTIAWPISVSLTFSKIKALPVRVPHTGRVLLLHYTTLPLVYQYSLTRVASNSIIIGRHQYHHPPFIRKPFHCCYIESEGLIRGIFPGYYKVTSQPILE